jgi:hypothetical protein
VNVRALFDLGWWSVGIWLTGSVSLTAGYGLAGFVGTTPARRDVMMLFLVFGGPFGALALVLLLLAVADPNPGCTYDCLGRLIVAVVGGVALVTWEAGLLLGSVHTHVRARRAGRSHGELNR